MAHCDTPTLASGHISFDHEHSQTQSPFFQLPGEVRDYIYTIALASFEDETRLYDTNTYWSRPQYSAPRKSDSSLLRTCKRAYNEAWFLPWSLADHTFWLTNEERAPQTGAATFSTFSDDLDQIHSHQGDFTIANAHFFAQLFILEPGLELSDYLSLPHFHPKTITITIRHTDWWWWENDDWLCIDAVWVNDCRFPASTRRIHLELESLERKQNQIDSLVAQMKEKWFFTKTDDSILSATRTEVATSKWRGSSTWDGFRWVRDEIEAESVNYYIATVTFEHEPDTDHESTTKTPPLQTTIRPKKIEDDWARVHTTLLERAQVPPGTKAADALELVRDHEQRRIQLMINGGNPHGHIGENVEDGGELSDTIYEYRDDDDDSDTDLFS